MAKKETPLRKQRQSRQPGLEYKMEPRPESDDPSHRGSGKLKNKVALITGGDSGIGRAAVMAFAKEEADVCLLYYDEHRDAEETLQLVEEQGRKCILISGMWAMKASVKRRFRKLWMNWGAWILWSITRPYNIPRTVLKKSHPGNLKRLSA